MSIPLPSVRIVKNELGGGGSVTQQSQPRTWGSGGHNGENRGTGGGGG